MLEERRGNVKILKSEGKLRRVSIHLYGQVDSLHRLNEIRLVWFLSKDRQFGVRYINLGMEYRKNTN
jgi:hypothetical protein